MEGDSAPWKETPRRGKRLRAVERDSAPPGPRSIGREGVLDGSHCLSGAGTGP
jgi:hypothetical protein